MDSSSDKDWKKRVGFPINYESSQSSDDDFDKEDVVMRHPRRSADYLLADRGDGSEADLLGTTPPRARIRNKEKRRTHMDELHLQRMFRENRNSMTLNEQLNTPDFAKKRLAIKVSRTKERDFKLDNNDIEHKADSLPPHLPETLVESCSRFMSLSSRLKCRQFPNKPDEEVEERWKESEQDEQLPPSRVNFHQTFSMLINMGNIEKGCRRTISREEQVWQNELKDLIWLELQAKIARRTLPQQDAYLCTQRHVVPNTVQNIVDYKFIRQDKCIELIEGADYKQKAKNSNLDVGCISFTCEPCMAAIGMAMKEVGALLDAFYNAMSLYPSSKAMTVEHPLIATEPFQDRVKAMCLWYNTASHMRMKIISIRRMMMSLQKKHNSRSVQTLISVDSQTSGCSSSVGHRNSQVRFEVNSRPTDSSNSDSSAHSDGKNDLDTGQNDPVLTKELDVSVSKDNLVQEEVHNSVTAQDETDSSNLKAIDSTSPATPEIVISSESPYSSASSGYVSGGVCDVADVTQLSQLRLLGNCHVSPYRDYHYEMLKTQGVRRCMMFVDKMRQYVLNKVYYTLERPQDNQADRSAEDNLNADSNEKKTEVDEEEAMNINELRRYGCWSEENLAMCLPSYRSHFLLLSSICMEAVHDYLSMRLEDRPDHPSCLTIKQLIHELKEGLDIATDIRLCFTRNLRASAAGAGGGGRAGGDLCRLLATFDDTVNSVYSEYVSYLTKISTTEHMPRAYIQSEWAFATQIARRNKSALLQAADTFCDIACNQINRLVKRFEDQFNQIKYTVPDTPEKHTLYALCREAQLIYSREREPALQAALSARALAASLPPPAHQHRHRLLTSLMSMRDCLVKHTELILERSQAAVHPCPTDDDARDIIEVGLARVRELLLQIYRLAFELHKELYRFAQAPFKSAQPPRRPASLQPMRHVEDIRNVRKRPGTMMITESINPTIHKELHRFVHDSSRVQLRKQGSCTWGRRLTRGDSVIDEVLYDHKMFEADGSTNSSIELILSGEPPKPEPPPKAAPPPAREEDRLWAGRVARAIISFAKCWMQFVVERCDRGRGLRPRWASQGLEFLMLACDPCNTKHLNDEEFEELKQLMDGCISHVVGSRPVTRGIESATTSHKHRTRLQSPLSHSSNGSNKEIPTPPTPPPNEADPLLNFQETEIVPTKSRVLEAIKRVDSERDRLLRERKAVGKVIERTQTNYEPKLRRLTFKWQRGLKIGAGTFGKVYTIVNTESGQLLAMKELNIGANDRRALQRAANELRVLEGVIHPHLVRYYGCELHREEMLIFMELCVEGSLEALVATSGALPEHLTRRYTKQLLSAVAELHARTIAHRDIKSGNIFLTNEGHCLKLGDFGCAVKIRAHSTAPGELQGFVGTQAYMAPEVFMKSSGHGRGADIWSLGCVVAEMASGKRPFSEYDSNYQIMFVVGMGGRPLVPDSLSDEGRQFCLSCLTHDSEQRPSAQTLTAHHFLKLQADDDCKCEPAYLK